MSWEDDLLADLERSEEDQVRAGWIKCKYGETGSPRQSVVERWLKSKEDARKSEREQAMLSTAREANSIALKARSEARRANTIAIIAIIFSTLVAIFTVSDKLTWVFQWFRIFKP